MNTLCLKSLALIASITVAQIAVAAPAARFSNFTYAGRPMAGARAAPPPGRYLNPVIAGSTSDPSIVRVGTDYYLAASSFTYWPGTPIFHSTDLVHWSQIGSAVSRADQMRIVGLDTWQGLYAPDLKFYDGRFYMTNACEGCGGIFVMTADRAGGPWSKPNWLPIEGIDPSIFFDDDGRAYIVNNGPPPHEPRWEGESAIWLQEIDLRTLKLEGPRTMLVDGGVDPAKQPFWIEGPHLIKHDGRYVLICAQGGTKEHHSEVAFRAETLRGPYVSRPNPILTQEGLDPRRPNPVVEAGHADLVSTPAGDWWAVFLASRPFGPGKLDYTTGRETYLLPVRWINGWPVILPPDTPIPQNAAVPNLPSATGTAPSAAGGRFTPSWRGPALDRRWLILGSPTSAWWRSGGGVLRVTAQGSLGGATQPRLVAVRQADPVATVSVGVRFTPASAHDAAGLSAYADRDHYWALVVAGRPGGGREIRVIKRIGETQPAAGISVLRQPIPATGPIRLKIVANGSSLSFAYSAALGRWSPIGPAQDGRGLTVTQTNGFSGSVLGVVALADAPI